jgi:hypothetical protein
VLSRPDFPGDVTMNGRHAAKQIMRKLKTEENLTSLGKSFANVCYAIEVLQTTTAGG